MTVHSHCRGTNSIFDTRRLLTSSKSYIIVILKQCRMMNVRSAYICRTLVQENNSKKNNFKELHVCFCSYINTFQLHKSISGLSVKVLALLSCT